MSRVSWRSAICGSRRSTCRSGSARSGRPPVLVMVVRLLADLDAVLLPSRQAPDLLAGHWLLLSRAWARCPQALVWDNESAVGSWRGGRPKLTDEFEAFRGTLGIRVIQCRPRDPEAKGLVERANGYLETSFLPGRSFTSPADFNAQLAGLAGAGQQPAAPGVGLPPGRPADADRAAMLALPPVPPAVGLADLAAAAAGPLRPPGRQRLLGAPGRGRAPGRGQRRPGPRHGDLRRHGASPTHPGAGPRHQSHHRPRARDAPPRSCARAQPRCSRTQPALARRRATPLFGDYDTAFGTDWTEWRDGHDETAGPGRDRRARVPDPGAESPDPARMRRPARRTGPRRVLDP